MNVLVQKQFSELALATGFSFFTDISDEILETTEVIVGDIDFLKSHPRLLHLTYKVLISDEQSLAAHQLSSIQPSIILNSPQHLELKFFFESIQQQLSQKKITQELSKEVQKKRKALEELNQQLVSESEAQFAWLQKSNNEEMQKNLNEKSLLYFLDFISSESLNDDFVSQILKLIWKELKKMGFAYQIGFCFENINQTVSVITYNGIAEKNENINLNILKEFNASLLATALGRPVGKTLSWKLSEFSRIGYFFVETIDQQFSIQDVELYFKERLFTLGLYFDRWLIEKEYQALIERWDQTFQSFSGFTHVIDENHVVYQSNYLEKSKLDSGMKCYEVLADSNKPCLNCPIYSKNQNDFYLKDSVKVRVSKSEFFHENKKYYFMFYEDMTNLDLLKSKMIQSEKMATLGRLGNHLSHELNNPLTGLKLYTQFLLSPQNEGMLTPSLKADFTEILKASERCEKIIKNLLQFSQESEISLTPVYFSDILDSTLTLLKTALRPHRLFIDLKKDLIAADPTALQQVLFNILKNACQAMENPGSIKIFQINQGDKITFCIQDSGHGLDASLHKNIFSPFMTTKKVGEGTGLGLYLSKKLMARMNADLCINYDYKNGFEVDLVFSKL